MNTLNRITFNPAVMGGRPCIRGMRITVGNVVNLLSDGCTVEAILADFPLLEEEDIRQALAFTLNETKEIDIPLNAAQVLMTENY